jgi:hypothetical protein
MGGGVNLLNINRIDVFAADHSSFPAIGCGQDAMRGRNTQPKRGRTGTCAVK